MIFYESKISVPNFSPYLIRERLSSFLESNLHRSLICLTSDGGYGKTTLVSSFVKDKHIPCVWYQLSYSDRDPQTFLSYLKTVIATNISGGQMTYDIPLDQMEEELEKIIAILSTWPKQLLIVLDNFQSIDQSEEVERILSTIISQVSPFVTFIITSRVRPNLQLSHLKLKNEFAELTTTELAFTKEEIGQFFLNLHGIGLHKDEINLIIDKTEGWAASLQLLKDLIKNMNEEQRAPFWSSFSGTADIYDYLGSEIMSAQPPEIKSFLYKTSLLADLNPDVINDYLEIDNAENILEHLMRNNMFIYKNNAGVIKYHNLFKAFLYRQLSKNLNNNAMPELHETLSSIYEQKSSYFYAFGHAVGADNFLQAARLMLNMEELYNPPQFLVLMDGLLEEISPDLTTASISLFLFRCIPLHIQKKLKISLEKNINGPIDSVSPVLLATLQHHLAAISFYTGDVNKAAACCNQSLQISRNNRDNKMVSINLALKSLIYWYIHKHEEAKAAAKESLSYPEALEHFHPHHLASWVIAEINLEQNNLEKAAALLKETLKISARRHDSSIVYPYCSMAKYYRLKGNQEKTLKWALKAIDLAKNFRLEFDLGWAYKELALTYEGGREWGKAEKCYTRAISFLEHADYLRCKVQELQITMWRNLGKQQAAADLMEGWMKTRNTNNYYWLSPPSEPETTPKNTARTKKAKLQLYTLGSFKIMYKGKPIHIKRKTSLYLLQYFITNRGKKVNKEMILEDVFGEGHIQSLNNQFYVALSHLRKTLEPDLTKGRDSLFIKRAGEHYILDTTNIHLDRNEFFELLDRSQNDDQEKRIQSLHQAEEVYRGNFLEEFPYNSFLEMEREECKTRYLELLHELAVYYWEKAQYKQSMEYYDRLLMKDPYREEIYAEFIKKLLDAGFSVQAKKVSKRYRKYIERELGLPVDDQIQEMFTKFSRN